MNTPTAWAALALEDPEPEQVLTRFEKALPGMGESHTFLLPDDLGFYDAENRELIAGFNRWMLELLRAVTPPGAFLHVSRSTRWWGRHSLSSQGSHCAKPYGRLFCLSCSRGCAEALKGTQRRA
jgi:hypothetical protein